MLEMPNLCCANFHGALPLDTAQQYVYAGLVGGFFG